MLPLVFFGLMFVSVFFLFFCFSVFTMSFVETHMLTIVSTTSIFQFISSIPFPLCCVVLCTIPFVSAAFHSISLRFFPYHYFTFPFFSLFHFFSSRIAISMSMSMPSISYHSIAFHPTPLRYNPFRSVWFQPISFYSMPLDSFLCRSTPLRSPTPVSIPFPSKCYSYSQSSPFHFSSSFSSFPLQSNSTGFTPFRSIPFHSIPLHYAPLLSIPFHSVPSHSVSLRSTRSIPLSSFLFLFCRLFFAFPFSFTCRSIPCLFIPLHFIPVHSTALQPMRPLIHVVARSFNHSITFFVKMFFQFFSFSLMLSCFFLFSLSLISGRQERRTPEVEKVKKTWRSDNTLPHAYFSTCVPKRLG